MSNGPAVEAVELTVRFGAFTAVDRISFQVARGEIFGFLGANGAGKTTTIRVLCGLLVPTEGRVSVAGLDPARGLAAVKAKVGYMSQKFTLYQDMTVEENLRFAAALRKIPKDIFAERRKRLLDLIGFEGSPDTLVRDLAGGVKQEVSLCAALLHEPEVVFLDEPTAGVTPAVRARFWGLIRELSASGRTVFVTTHYMDEAEQCGRIALMREGRIVALDSPAALKKTAFQETLIEINPHQSGVQDWVEKLASRPGVLQVTPYGLRYHALVADAAAWEAEARDWTGQFSYRRIEPSLEDVFIRVVEGVKPRG